MTVRSLRPAFLLSIVFLASCGGEQSATPDAVPAAGAGEANAAQVAQGKSLYPTCATCHGQQAEGMQAMNAPALAHQEAWYLEQQLNNYRADIRGVHPDDTYGAQMAPMSKTLANEEAVKAVVAYIRTLPGKKPELTVQGDVDKGKEYYNMICAACHGNRAQGNEPLHSPALLGTNDWYLLRQTNNFRLGIRGTHEKDTYGSQMHTIAKDIPDEETARNIVAYINTLSNE